MTDSENSAVQEDSDEDIYKDFSDFNFADELAKIEESKEIYKKKANDLSEKVKELNEENHKLKNLNVVLEKNLSTLLKTAQAEVKRKDSAIAELREQIESLTFRRSSKFTKDKYTWTENWESVIDLKTISKDCNCSRESEKAHSFTKRSSHDNDWKSSKYENKKVEKKVVKQKSPDCDNQKKLNYCNVSPDLTSAGIVNGNTNQTPGKAFGKDTYSVSMQRNNPKRSPYPTHRERNESIRPSRQDRREHSKDFDRKRHLRKSDNHYSSSQERNSRNSRDGSFDRHRRKELRRTKSRSRSQDCTRKNKESCLEKHRSSRSSLEKDSKSRNRHQPSTKARYSDGSKNASKGGEDNKRHAREKDQDNANRIIENYPDEKFLTINEKVTSEVFDTKSPLDAPCGEFFSSKNYDSFLKPITDLPRKHDELEEGECVEEDYSNPVVNNMGKEGALPFKNERQNMPKPMTLFSKRMMKRLSMGSKPIENKSLQDKEISKKENFKDVELEREPGELTDDENEVERSEEFQKVAKAAFFENKIIDELPVTTKDVFVDGPKTVNDKTIQDSKDNCKKFSEPQTLPQSQELLVSDQKMEDVKEIREVIEFSPFKNNYKLFEISPAKTSEKNYLLEDFKNKLNSNTSKQKKSEASISNHLLHPSGIPMDVNDQKVSEKTENVSEVPELLKCDSSGGDGGGERTGEKSESEKIIEENKNLCQSQVGKNCKNKTTISKKNVGSQEEKKVEKKLDHFKNHSEENGKEKNDCCGEITQKKIRSEKIAQEKNDFEKAERKKNNSQAVSEETAQFLDFFLLASYPTKSENFENREKSIDENPIGKKIGRDSPTEKSESDEGNRINRDASSELREPTKKGTRISKPKSVKSASTKDGHPSKTPPVRHSKERENQCLDSMEKSGKSPKSEGVVTRHRNAEKSEEKTPGRGKRKASSKGEKATGEKSKSKRKLSDCEDAESKKPKLDKEGIAKKKGSSPGGSSPREEQESISFEGERVKEDISFFEFFKPITKKEEEVETSIRFSGPEELSNSTDFKMTKTTTTSLRGVVCLETPNKRVEKLKNLTINEQTIYQVLDSKNGSPFSPLLGAKLVEMTPRRMLKNDLMLTDSEDDSAAARVEDIGGKAEENFELSESETSDCESDSGASDFVDLL